MPAFANIADLSASDFPSSPLSSSSTATVAASSLPTARVPSSPVHVSSEPSYLERYTSFYSSTPADKLLTTLSTTLTTHHIDHTLCRFKAKLCVSFQCPMLSSLTVSFILRLYRSATRPNTLIVEGQRREGCVVAFHHVWGRLVSECKALGLCTGLVEEAQKETSNDASSSEAGGVLGMCSLLGSKASATSPMHPLSSASSPTAATSTPNTPALPCFQLDASASAILSGLVDNGDICQQRDALRLLSLSLGQSTSPSVAAQCQTFLSSIARWAAPATDASSSSTACVDDERTAQLARLMLVCSQKGSTDAFVHQCAQSLFSLLDELVVRQPPADMSMCRMRGLRCLLQVVRQLCCAEGGRVMARSHDVLAVLERCATIPDAAVQKESKDVLQRLAQAC